MLDNLREFAEALYKNRSLFLQNQCPTVDEHDLYCPPCGKPMRMRIKRLHAPACANHLLQMKEKGEVVDSRFAPTGVNRAPEHWQDLLDWITPSMYELKCSHCERLVTAVIYSGPDGTALAMLPSTHGGLRTPHTPDGVSYYLDQAHRAQSVGANSAAVAMFRSALEQLLLNKGFKVRMCGPKIQELEKEIKSDRPPKWAKDLNTKFLLVMNELAKEAIHASDGNIDAQKALDSKLLAVMQRTFLHLLDLAYERESKEKSALKELEGPLQAFQSAANDSAKDSPP